MFTLNFIRPNLFISMNRTPRNKSRGPRGPRRTTAQTPTGGDTAMKSSNTSRRTSKKSINQIVNTERNRKRRTQPAKITRHVEFYPKASRFSGDLWRRLELGFSRNAVMALKKLASPCEGSPARQWPDGAFESSAIIDKRMDVQKLSPPANWFSGTNPETSWSLFILDIPSIEYAAIGLYIRGSAGDVIPYDTFQLGGADGVNATAFYIYWSDLGYTDIVPKDLSIASPDERLTAPRIPVFSPIDGSAASGIEWSQYSTTNADSLYSSWRCTSNGCTTYLNANSLANQGMKYNGRLNIRSQPTVEGITFNALRSSASNVLPIAFPAEGAVNILNVPNLPTQSSGFAALPHQTGNATQGTYDTSMLVGVSKALEIQASRCAISFDTSTAAPGAGYESENNILVNRSSYIHSPDGQLSGPFLPLPLMIAIDPAMSWTWHYYNNLAPTAVVNFKKDSTFEFVPALNGPLKFLANDTPDVETSFGDIARAVARATPAGMDSKDNALGSILGFVAKHLWGVLPKIAPGVFSYIMSQIDKK